MSRLLYPTELRVQKKGTPCGVPLALSRRGGIRTHKESDFKSDAYAIPPLALKWVAWGSNPRPTD